MSAEFTIKLLALVAFAFIMTWFFALLDERRVNDGSWIAHGVRIVTGHRGEEFKIFDPPPWRLDQWLMWLVLWRRSSAKITLHAGRTTRTVRIRRV